MNVFFLIHNLVLYIPAREYLTCFSRPRVGNLTQKIAKVKCPGVPPPPPPWWWKQMIGALSLVLDKVMRFELECDLVKCVCAVILPQLSRLYC
jgi:hypothetical protein